MQEFSINTTKNQEIVDITQQVKDIVERSDTNQGICLVYLQHASAAITINENFDPNICNDILDCLNNMIPQGKWLHDKIDDNGAAHIKASIIGPSETIPIENNRLMLGKWQSIMVVDFDGPRKRKIIINIIKNKGI